MEQEQRGPAATLPGDQAEVTKPGNQDIQMARKTEAGRELGNQTAPDRRALVNAEGADGASPLSSPKSPSPAQHATVQRSEKRPALTTADRRHAAWSQCATIASSPRVLDCVAEAVESLGLIGSSRAVKLIYLVVTTRFLDRPVCAAIKGPSSAGKSYALDRTLQLFPTLATVQLSSMSEKALAYLSDDLKHKTLVIAEAAGLGQGTGAYFLRSLISEGRLCHATVDTSVGLKGVKVEREGPTGLLMTTTKSQLDPDLETRLFSIPVDDSSQQTANIMLAAAQKAAGGPTGSKHLDLDPWRAFQEWLGCSEHRVVIPFAERLAEMVPPKAIRLRRDFGALLALIQAHAILHQASRERDELGRIVATLDDYAAVHELVGDLMAQGVEASVPPNVRETVEAVRMLKSKYPGGVHLSPLAEMLGLDKASVSRRVQEAVERGYLRNEEDRPGRPARVLPDQPLLKETEVLPQLDALADRCSVARCKQVRPGSNAQLTPHALPQQSGELAA